MKGFNDKGKGKGKSDGCFNCGAHDHYARNCPRLGGKGGFGAKGWKGGQMRMLDGPYDEYSWREYEPIYTLKTCMSKESEAEDVKDLYGKMELLDKSIEDLCDGMHDMEKSVKEDTGKWRCKNVEPVTVAN